MGGAALIYLAALQSIRRAVRGGRARRRRTAPPDLARDHPADPLVLSLMAQVIATMQVFVELFLLTGGAEYPEWLDHDRRLPDLPVRLQLQQLRCAAALGLLLLVLLAGFRPRT